MKERALQVIWLTIALASTGPALSHDCRVQGNSYLRGSYEGDCDESSEAPEGQGEATGADRYIGAFVKGKPDGKGTYTWQNGARLDGFFKQGKAHGAGVYVSAKGIRYEGKFENGQLQTLKPEDCPATQGPIGC